MRKLKSIKQILEENPDAYFNNEGKIVCHFWGFHIEPKMFHLFGGGIEDHHFNLYHFDESWFEEPPKPVVKKLYAYIDTSSDTAEVRWCLKDNRGEYFHLKRFPNLDKTYEVKE